LNIERRKRDTQDQLDFQFKIGSALTGTGWTDDNSLDFKSPDIAGTAGSRNGNSAADRSALTHTITGLTLLSGQSVAIRWADLNITGTDDGLAVDDFSLTITVIPEPGTWLACALALSAIGWSQRRRFCKKLKS
jgi:hypothetical protein